MWTSGLPVPPPAPQVSSVFLTGSLLPNLAPLPTTKQPRPILLTIPGLGFQPLCGRAPSSPHTSEPPTQEAPHPDLPSGSSQWPALTLISSTRRVRWLILVPRSSFSRLPEWAKTSVTKEAIATKLTHTNTTGHFSGQRRTSGPASGLTARPAGKLSSTEPGARAQARGTLHFPAGPATSDVGCFSGIWEASTRAGVIGVLRVFKC